MDHDNDSVQRACKDFEQDLILYYYEECESKERDRVASHLEGCPACRKHFSDLRNLLSITASSDEPPQAFWQNYSREMSRKLAAAEQRSGWWRGLTTFFHPWPVPALATALILLIVVTFTFTSGLWHSQDIPLEEEALLEVLPMAENIEFFKAMEVLDTMDFLEDLGNQSNGSA
ncbi:MAG: zf-HC2 domain-containing protein [Candidatus Binatia bacterium]